MDVYFAPLTFRKWRELARQLLISQNFELILSFNDVSRIQLKMKLTQSKDSLLKFDIDLNQRRDKRGPLPLLRLKISDDMFYLVS